jgi:predicted nucleic acid-binding Zn ribbon protein
VANATPPLPGFEPGARRTKRRHRPPREQQGRRYPERTCEVCGKRYEPTYSKQQACGRECGAELRRRNGWLSQEARDRNAQHRDQWPASRVYFLTCEVCGRTASAQRNRKTCSEGCRMKRLSQRMSARIIRRYRSDPEFRDRVLAKAHARRADKLGLESQAVLLGYLIKRDRGRCGICHQPVRAKKGPMRPSIDHIVPLSRGGTHELSNVQLAHYRCNLQKWNGGDGEQLLLIG